MLSVMDAPKEPSTTLRQDCDDSSDVKASVYLTLKYNVDIFTSF